MEVMLAEIVLIVQQQFPEAGSGDTGEFKLRLFRGGGGETALRDILHAAAGGLDHLVMGAGLFIHKLIAENDGAVINQLAALKVAEITKAAGGWD